MLLPSLDNSIINPIPIHIKEKYLLLDIGGTIVHITEPFDVYTKRAIGYVYDALNPNVARETFIRSLYQERIDIRKQAERTLIEYSFREFIKRGLQRFNIEISNESANQLELMYIKAELETTELFADTVPFLQKTKNNSKIICAATNNFSVSHVYELLKKFNIGSYFSAVHISGEIRIRKPDKKFLDTIRSHQNIPMNRNDCVLIGDKLLIDILSGKRSGVKTCFLDRNGYTAVKPIKNVSPDFVISSLSEIEF